MRFHERATNLQWKKGTKRPDKSNAIDMLCSGQTPKTDIEKRDYERNFEVVPTPFSESERDEWINQLNDVVVSSDAFCKYPPPNLVYFRWPHWSFSLVFAACRQLLVTVHKDVTDFIVPFIDNILYAGRLGVKYVAAPMGSQNDGAVANTCQDLGMTRKHTLPRVPLRLLYSDLPHVATHMYGLTSPSSTSPYTSSVFCHSDILIAF